jgi:hypothetical protein
MMSRRLVLVIVLALLNVHVSAKVPTTALNTAQPKLDRLGQSIATRKCTHPSKLIRKPIQNRHDPLITDEIQTYSCRGFEITTYKANYFKPPHEFPISLVVTATHPKLPKWLSIGSAATDVQKILGTPQQTDGESLTYSLDGESEGTIAFSIANDRIQSITWTWDVE